MYELLKRALFRLDAETAHELAIWQLERLQANPALVGLASLCWPSPSVAPYRAWGMEFPNRLGLAGGFDKNARVVEALEVLGFGFIEVGTVTRYPQPGNPRPRIFRYPLQKALVNRLGFNNDGADAIRGRLRALVERRGTGRKHSALFVNIGKNRDVPEADARASYAACFQRVAPYADAIVVNVSSPNTPGLRNLQRPSALAEILESLRELREHVVFETDGDHPIFVKLSPDLDREELAATAAVCVTLADGIIATNTTMDHSTLPGSEGGGLSGAPLFARATEVLILLRNLVGRSYPLLGVGGIMDGDSARAKLSAGADLIQVYTGFVYGGPAFPSRIVKEIQ
ncbi:MAG TPA: quinone-dependent dihydroorotate dehydrogenase [Thermoanaerobaculia bacterium]|nr:quinone-dependent dihydroorotate dehydrogenase [Thermoanaerobaculia bacterium]